MSNIGLDFEKPIIELENKIEELKSFTEKEEIDLSEEIKTLENRLEKVKKEIYDNLSPWQRVQTSRHPKRPYTLDYINMIMTDFIEIHGDRHYGDDKALVCGLAKFQGQNIVVMGHQKGKDTKENLERNFGSAHPEGYRKALRVMKMAKKYHLPVVVFIDTPGAYPGIGAEERGQAEAIAFNLREMTNLKTPIVGFVIGEGGSGGALGIGVVDKMYVLENAYYSVISPEGCAAILWKDRLKADLAAQALKITAKELITLGLIDGMVKEPMGGAHKEPSFVANNIADILKKELPGLLAMDKDSLLNKRYEKYRNIGKYSG